MHHSHFQMPRAGGRKQPWHGNEGVRTENLIRVDAVMESPSAGGLIGLLCFVLAILGSPFKSKLRLEAENAVLRHQLIVLKRSCMVASGSRT
jgi:hypothetical protein